MERERKIFVGPLELCPDSTVNRAFWNRTRVPLRRFEFQLLILLEPGSGKIISSLSLKEAMKRQGFVSPIRSSIRKLRETFRRVDPSFNEVVNEWGFGYGWKTF